jgi:hypothetical protein
MARCRRSLARCFCGQRAAGVFGTGNRWTSVRYRRRRPDDAHVRKRQRELAAMRRRFGYRRSHILLTREGMMMNHKKLRASTGRSGCRSRKSNGTTSRLASRCRMSSWRASTDGFMTSCSTRRSSCRSRTPGKNSPIGWPTTTRNDLIAVSGTCRLRFTPSLVHRARRGATLHRGASRPVPLHQRVIRAQLKPETLLISG